MTEEEIVKRVAETLALVALPGIEQMAPADLSGGMRKRVALARAVAVRPEIVFYDEPAEGLDPINVTRVNRLLLGLQQEPERHVRGRHPQSQSRVRDQRPARADSRWRKSSPPARRSRFSSRTTRWCASSSVTE